MSQGDMGGVPVGLCTAPQACLTLCCREGESKAGLLQKRTRCSSARAGAFPEGLMDAIAFCPSASLTASLTEAAAPAPA